MTELKSSYEQIYKYRHQQLNTKNLGENYVSGYASVFGVKDHHNDIVSMGSFNNSIQKFVSGKSIPLLWQHMHDKPIGNIEQILEDEYGLYIVAKILPNITYGREALELIKSGIICCFSIGFNPMKHYYDYDQDARIIEEIDLWEVSLVTFPANEHSSITAFRQLET